MTLPLLIAMLAGSLALTACTATAPDTATPESATPDAATSPPPPEASSTPAPAGGTSSDADGALYPQGASAETPECQSASPATVAAVNATFDDPTPRDASGVDRLVASPDPDHAVWMLTGVIPSTSGSEGYLVAWATTVDPTQEVFEGALRSIGGVTATMSSAPALQFADVGEAGGLPPSAMRCLPALSRDSSR